MKQQGHFDTSKEAVQIWKMIVDFDRYVQLLNATLRPKSSVRGFRPIRRRLSDSREDACNSPR